MSGIQEYLAAVWPISLLSINTDNINSDLTKLHGQNIIVPWQKSKTRTDSIAYRVEQSIPTYHSQLGSSSYHRCPASPNSLQSNRSPARTLLSVKVQPLE